MVRARPPSRAREFEVGFPARPTAPTARVQSRTGYVPASPSASAGGFDLDRLPSAGDILDEIAPALDLVVDERVVPTAHLRRTWRSRGSPRIGTAHRDTAVGGCYRDM